jgi:DNA-nicking Smr family endonuclease
MKKPLKPPKLEGNLLKLFGLEHFQQKWEPVLRLEMRKNKELERRIAFDRTPAALKINSENASDSKSPLPKGWINSPSTRFLSDNEAWAHALRDVKPLPGRIKAEVPQQPRPAPLPSPSAAFETVSSCPPTLLRRPAGFPELEKPFLREVVKGKRAIDRRLDLHGFQQDMAFQVLMHFLRGAQRDGARLVLVITGKGNRGTAESPGILRRLVPMWLGNATFAGLVSAVSPAHPTHGGNGAFYIKLKPGFS